MQCCLNHHAETQEQELYACKGLMQTKRRKYISANTSCEDRKGDFNSTTQQRHPVQQRTAH